MKSSKNLKRKIFGLPNFPENMDRIIWLILENESSKRKKRPNLPKIQLFGLLANE